MWKASQVVRLRTLAGHLRVPKRALSVSPMLTSSRQKDQQHKYKAVIFDMGGVLIPSPGLLFKGKNQNQNHIQWITVFNTGPARLFHVPCRRALDCPRPLKKAGNSLLFQNTHSAADPGRGNAFCLRHVSDTRHVGDGRVYPVFIWIRYNWIGSS